MKIRVSRALISTLSKPLFTSPAAAAGFSTAPNNRRRDRSSEDRFLRSLDFGAAPDDQSAAQPRRSPPPDPIPNRPLRGDSKPQPWRQGDDLFPDPDRRPPRLDSKGDGFRGGRDRGGPAGGFSDRRGMGRAGDERRGDRRTRGDEGFDVLRKHGGSRGRNEDPFGGDDIFNDGPSRDRRMPNRPMRGMGRNGGSSRIGGSKGGKFDDDDDDVDDLFDDFDDEPKRDRRLSSGRSNNRPVRGMGRNGDFRGSRGDGGSRAIAGSEDDDLFNDFDDEQSRDRRVPPSRTNNKPRRGMRRDDGFEASGRNGGSTRIGNAKEDMEEPFSGGDDLFADMDDELSGGDQPVPPSRTPNKPKRGTRRDDGFEASTRHGGSPRIGDTKDGMEGLFSADDDLFPDMDDETLDEPRARGASHFRDRDRSMRGMPGDGNVGAKHQNGESAHISGEEVAFSSFGGGDLLPDLEDETDELSGACQTPPTRSLNRPRGMLREDDLEASLQNGGPTQARGTKGDTLSGSGNKFGASLLEKMKFGKEAGESSTNGPTQISGAGLAVSEQLVEDADVIFKKMKETGLIPNAVAMLDGLCKDGLVQEAMKLFGLMREKGTIPEVVVYTAVVDGFCKAQKFDDAQRVFRKMQANGISPNAFSYGLLIQGLCRGKKLEDSLELCKEMVDAGCSPNAATFTGLIQGYCVEKGVEEAESVIKSLQERGFALDERAIREHLDKKGPFSPMVHEAVFGKKNSQRPS